MYGEDEPFLLPCSAGMLKPSAPEGAGKTIKENHKAVKWINLVDDPQRVVPWNRDHLEIMTRPHFRSLPVGPF